ncbi:hypothetical protein ACLKA6_002433 [Drosophila palustris]
MHSWVLVFALAAVMLETALALPVKLDESEDVALSDDELLNLLGGKSVETDSISVENIRRRRAAGEDSDSSSAEDNQDKVVPKDNERGSSNSASSEEEEKTKEGKTGASSSARRKRTIPEDTAIEELLAAIDFKVPAEDTDEINHDDYAQGCDVNEELSNEVNNETFTE